MDQACPPTETSRVHRWWRRWYVKAIVISFLTIGAFYAIERQIGEWAWKNYQREAAARGVKLLLTDFQQPPIPEEENYAAAPFFKTVLSAADPNAEGEKLLQLPAFPSSGPKSGLIGPLDLTNRQKGFINARWIPQASESPAADVLLAMERMEPTLAQIRLASSRPKTRWPVDWSDGAAAKTPFLGILEQATLAFGLRVRALLALDRPDEALSEIRHMIRMDQSLAETPTMISGLVRIANWNVILESCEQGIVSNKWQDSHLQVLAKEAGAVNFLAEWKFHLSGERGFGNQAINKLVTADRATFGKMARDMISPGAKVSTSANVVWFVAPRGWVRQNQVDYNKLIDMDLEDMDALQERVSSEFSRAWSQIGQRSQTELDWYYTLSSASAAVSYTASKRAFRLHSSLQHFRILCSAAQYHHAHGELPEMLSPLVPKYLSAIPHDIMSGEPMRYRRTEEGGCIIWSIGINRADDGGVERTPGQGFDSGDWILRISPISVK
jgi:hypothetical protein